MKILYIFKSSEKNIKLAENFLFPKLFYGYFELKKDNDVRFIDVVKSHNCIIKVYKKLFCNDSMSKILKNNIDLFNQYDIVYATTDGIAIEIAKLKKEKLIKTKVIGNIMSIADNKYQNPNLYLLDYLDGIICFSKKIECYLYNNNIRNIKFIKFGIDTNFYKKTNSKKSNVVLSIGLDLFRDWNTFNKVAKLMPNVEFKVITNNDNRKLFSLSNITFLGNTSFVQTRNEISKAGLIFLPTQSNHYFSGQTTLFNALSMKKYVLMPIDGNFLEYGFDENMFYNRKITEYNIVNRIKLALNLKKSHELKVNHKILINQFNELCFSCNVKKYMRIVCEK
jgi:hypothetical protein